MIHAGVGHSLDSTTAKAAHEAATRAMTRAMIPKADFALVFASVSHVGDYGEIFEAVQRVAGTDQISGCSALGILTTDCEVEQNPSLAVMVLSSDTLRLTPFLENDLSGQDLKVGNRVGGLCGNSQDQRSLLTIFPDPFTMNGEQLLKGISSSVPGMEVIGGAASEGSGSGRTFQMMGNKIISGGMSGFCMSGSFHHTIGISQACHSIQEPMIVTRAEENTIYELSGRPALEVLADLFSEPSQQRLAAASGLVFVGFPADPNQSEIVRGEYLVRHIVSILPERGGVTIQDSVRPGQAVMFALRDAHKSEKDMAEMLGEQARIRSGFPPRFGIYFNCCGRGTSLYGRASVDRNLIRERFGDLPVIGFSSFAEFAPVNGRNLLHNYSGVLILISE